MSTTQPFTKPAFLHWIRESTTEWERFFMLVIVLQAVSILYLTAQTFVRFTNDSQISGFDADAVTSSGDGYLIAGFTGAAIVATAAALIAPRAVSWFMPVVGLAGVAILAVAGYDIGASWHASGVSDSGAIFISDGSVAAPAYAVAVLGGLMAVVAALIVGLSYWETAEERAEG
jgi:hypothetical protein